MSSLLPKKRITGEIRYARTLRLLGVLYVLMAVVFFFFPTQWLYVLNLASHAVPFTKAMPAPADQLWCVWAGSQTVTLAALSFLSAESPRIRGYGLAHLLAKTVAALGYFYFYLNAHPYFVYLLGGAIETGLFVILAWRLLRANSGRQQREPSLGSFAAGNSSLPNTHLDSMKEPRIS